MMNTWLAPLRAHAPDAFERIEAEAAALASRWQTGELGEANAVAYVAWHHLGADGEHGGFLQLQRFAVRVARGDTELGTEAAIATWLDVRERLDALQERLDAGRSVPDFRRPTDDLASNCWRYHRVQARLRVEGRWSHAAREAPGEVDAMPAPPSRVAEARTHALQLHFAAWWYQLDTRTRRTRSGRVKGRSWWWTMLEHALDLTEVLDLGSDRNDPTEAMHRLRLRFAVCLGLGPWLRRWAAGRPYWSRLAFTLPVPDHPARDEVAAALDRLRPLLHDAIEALPEATEEERQGLLGVLHQGWNVRTTTRRFRGANPAERWQRMLTLATEAGMHIARPPGRGDPRLLTEIAAEVGPPSRERVAALAQALRDPELREQWVALAEAEPYLEAVAGMPTATGRSPWRWRWRAVAVVTSVALVALALGSLAPDPIGLRGEDGVPAAYLDLTVAHAGGGVERVDGSLVVGDRVYFQVAAEAPADVEVWVTGPEGRERLATAAADDRPRSVDTPEGVLYYTVEEVGTYVFQASAEPDGQCSAERCVRHVVQVGP